MAGGLRNRIGILRAASKARASHSSRACVVISMSNDEAWPKEKITGLGCQGLGLKNMRSLKRLMDPGEAGTVSTAIYACGIPRFTSVGSVLNAHKPPATYDRSSMDFQLALLDGPLSYPLYS